MNPAHGGLTLVGVGLGIVHGLVLLVESCVLGCTCAGPEACVGVLSNVLVCLLSTFVGGALDGLGDVVCGVLIILVSKIQSSHFDIRLRTLAVSIMIIKNQYVSKMISIECRFRPVKYLI